MHQTERPAHFNNRWRVAGWHDETPNAQRVCEVLGYMETEEGDHVQVRFLDSDTPATAVLAPHMLLPALP